VEEGIHYLTDCRKRKNSKIKPVRKKVKRIYDGNENSAVKDRLQQNFVDVRKQRKKRGHLERCREE